MTRFRAWMAEGSISTRNAGFLSIIHPTVSHRMSLMSREGRNWIRPSRLSVFSHLLERML